MTQRMGLPATEVIDRFVAGEVGGTKSTAVPGGRRLTSVQAVAGLTLRSYATEVAVRGTINGEVIVAVTPKRYSVSTSKALGRLRRALAAAGWRETSDVTPVMAKVPGRWGGYGPAWAPSSHEMVPFTVWRR